MPEEGKAKLACDKARSCKERYFPGERIRDGLTELQRIMYLTGMRFGSCDLKSTKYGVVETNRNS
jgi:hypothetical protein